MRTTLNEITDKALHLPIQERTILAQRLWESVEGFTDPEVERAWLDTAEKRWIEIEEEKVTCIPGSEAIEKARMNLKL